MGGTKGRVLSDEDRWLIRQLRADHLAAKARRTEIEQQILELMDERDEMMARESRTTNQVIADKFGVSPGSIAYICRARGTEVV